MDRKDTLNQWMDRKDRSTDKSSVRNFPFQTPKISKVSLVVMGHNDTPCGQPAPGRPIGNSSDWTTESTTAQMSNTTTADNDKDNALDDVLD
jgi:hypothetical protein